ncbi:DUF5054 domain-containing protein [Cohnella sp. WQ 127256]|uniref:DUF5054 domain-containing protein n=1 Tax=Cohnella sp. WQ 127256 TaxID=2938790 RepID=UPI0021173156|nr:DUF5054 domain-containing protein [Cohnella sp. WQ 127256]
MRKIETVHVIFKTHLDIGFTDLAHNVVDQYRYEYIPKAIELAERLSKEQGQAGFIWTTGSWLIHEYLKQASVDQRSQMEQAIQRGFIAWHGLPFTTHTELMDPQLFEYGLSLSHSLDARFGKQTIASKMTDVPGHTRAIIPHMVRGGIKYLHLGVNPASTMPSVPNVFLWKGEDGSDIIVNYAADYGDLLEVEGLTDIMVFAHTGDNCGPPSIEDIQRQFSELSERYPGATVKASTMDDFTRKLLAFKDQLPIVLEEIGDTWIHGTASDPRKLAEYRALLRLRNEWIEHKRFDLDSREYIDFSDNLLLIAEHTWGMDEKKFLSDFKNYTPESFASARQADLVSADAIPDKYRYLGFFRMHGMSEKLGEDLAVQASYSRFESSWQEQRNYIGKALAALDADKQTEVRASFRELDPIVAVPDGAQPIATGETYSFGSFEVEFSADGSIQMLKDFAGKVWADDTHRLGLFAYETFGVDNYHTWYEQYIQNIDTTYSWADSDFGKPGMENLHPQPMYRKYVAHVSSLEVVHKEEADIVFVILRAPSIAVKQYGAPEKIVIEYRFSKHHRQVDVTLHWFDKQANRLPEAIWLSFAPKVDNPNQWKMDKLGEEISPLEVVKNGNRNLHAVNRGVFYHGADGGASIETLDAALVSPGEGRLLQHDNTFAGLDGGMHFLLYNNVWGTNFPMWYEENAKFRFSLVLQA